MTNLPPERKEIRHPRKDEAQHEMSHELGQQRKCQRAQFVHIKFNLFQLKKLPYSTCSESKVARASAWSFCASNIRRKSEQARTTRLSLSRSPHRPQWISHTSSHPSCCFLLWEDEEREAEEGWNQEREREKEPREKKKGTRRRQT